MMQTRTLSIGSFVFILIIAIMGACGTMPPATTSSTTATATATVAAPAHTMEHATTTGVADAPYDALFLDGMIAHHEGALLMSKQALESAEHAEIKQLAESIISSQQAEIERMQGWRKAWYPDLPETVSMVMDMGMMNVAEGAAPFDQRFIEAMVSHHAGGVAMAREALQKSERQEIKTLAQAIITAQEAEIAQLRQWRKQWYGAE